MSQAKANTTTSGDAPADPIFIAIFRHKLAEHQLNQVLERVRSAFDFRKERDRLAYRRMKRPVDQAAIALMDTVPTTPGGVAALLWYVRSNQEADLSFSCESILRIMRRRAGIALAASEDA